MNEREIVQALECHPVTRNFFKGVFARDEINGVLRNNSFIIVNTDTRQEKGHHWVLCSRFSNSVSYFDSFGLPPLYAEFYDCLLKNSPVINYNMMQLQNEESETCGFYCIYFALQLCLGESLQAIRMRFTNNTKLNDRVLCSLIGKQFSYDQCNVGMGCRALLYK